MEDVSILSLKQQLSPAPATCRVHCQLERSQKKTTKNGEPFFELTFTDAEEKMVLRVWSNAPMFASASQMQERQFYELAGEFALAGDGRSVDGKSWTPRALNAGETERLLAGSAGLQERQARDYHFIETAVANLSDPRLRAVCQLCLDRYGARLRRTAAARDYHHARRGGLVEHVARMMQTALQISQVYTQLNADLLVSGILFHDIGKLWENAYEEKGFSMPYTEISELLGHIPLGVEIINKLWRELAEDDAVSREWDQWEPATNQVRLHLLHLVLSHHGELAFGSPVVPKTPEAQALHYIDNLDAKMEMFDRGYQISNVLGKNIHDRVHPLPGKLIVPLPSCSSEHLPSATVAEDIASPSSPDTPPTMVSEPSHEIPQPEDSASSDTPPVEGTPPAHEERPDPF